MVRRWYVLIDRMHHVRLGHASQSVVENSILISSFFCRSMAGVQLLLVHPIGHVACSRSQSTWKWAASKPSPALACHL